MKTKITVSLCISKDFEIDVEDNSLLYDTFINQYLPDNISEYSSEDDKWFIDNIEIIENGNN